LLFVPIVYFDYAEQVTVEGEEVAGLVYVFQGDNELLDWS